MTFMQQSAAELSVPRWTDLLSGHQARFPGFWIGLGKQESRVLADRLSAIPVEKPVYICGLARSGTTILLQLLSRHPELSSHRYRDFPPVFTPWFWNWFVDHAGQADHHSSERAHGDGIHVTPESPEAIEEVIWMAFFPQQHDPEVNSQLTADTSNSEFEAFYRDHIRKLLLIRGGHRYLSKGNYNLTRLRYILKLFPDASIILPVRDPAWHIASLMRQHERFCREHERDIRLQRHMSRSGHFEFGLDRRPINSGNTEITRQVLEHWSSGREVEGWALYWKDIYGHVADALESDSALRRAAMVVNYGTLCDRPAHVMRLLLAHCQLTATGVDLIAEAADTVRHPSYYEPSFNEEQLAHIEHITGPVAGRLYALAA
jgi:hypothetical protein